MLSERLLEKIAKINILERISGIFPPLFQPGHDDGLDEADKAPSKPSPAKPKPPTPNPTSGPPPRIDKPDKKPVDVSEPSGKAKGWRHAKSILALREQINDMAPARSKASDGTIGDASHQSRDSDHNPWIRDGSVGVVTAIDITNDRSGGCNAEALTAGLVVSRDPRIKYIIWNRRMVRSYRKGAIEPWTWTAYSGSSPHTKHFHLSVSSDPDQYDDVNEWNFGQAGASVAAATAKSDKAAGIDEIAWGRKVDPAFKAEVIAVSKHIQCDPNFLMAAMAFETGRRFSANVQNPTSKATGLIQFMPETAKALGVSIAELAAMSPVRQLFYVERYFTPHKGKLATLEDVYMAILWPKAIGKMSSFVLFAAPSKAYALNKGLDANSDGAVTKAEAADRVQRLLIEGMTDHWRG